MSNAAVILPYRLSVSKLVFTSFGYAAWSGVRPLSTRVVNPEILGENYVFADS